MSLALVPGITPQATPDPYTVPAAMLTSAGYTPDDPRLGQLYWASPFLADRIVAAMRAHEAAGVAAVWEASLP